MRGLPGSGKSTKAKEIMERDGNTVRVNKDLLRTMLHFDRFTNNNEKVTREVSQIIAGELLTKGLNVIIDDTNLNPKTFNGWREIAEFNDAKVEVVGINTLVEECIARDETRDKKVGRTVIYKMALQYLDYMKGENVVLCDLDGTLCDIEHRLKYGKGEEKNWDKFFSGISDDKLRYDVRTKVLDATIGNKLILVSARPEKYRKVTEDWLYNYGIDYEVLIMREDNDKRNDTEVKSDMYEKYFKNLNIIKIFDDRPRVIRMWREKGLEVEDVGNGIEF